MKKHPRLALHSGHTLRGYSDSPPVKGDGLKKARKSLLIVTAGPRRNVEAAVGVVVLKLGEPVFPDIFCRSEARQRYDLRPLHFG